MSDDITGQASRNAEMGLRVAMQLGQYLAQIRQQQLIKAEQESQARAGQMRQVMNTERELARPVLEQAVTEDFWDVATPEDAAKAYGLASRFEHVDPQAAVAARKIEQEVLERWDVDLTISSPMSVQDSIELAAQQQAIEQAQAADNPWMQAAEQSQDLAVPPPPFEVTETVTDDLWSPGNLGSLHQIVLQIPGDPFTDDDWRKALSEAVTGVAVQECETARLQDRADHARIEAREVQAETPGETTPEVEFLEDRADTLQGDADGAWDTLDARQDYAASVKGQAPDAAIRARVSADKGFTKPGRRSVEKTKTKTPVKRPTATQQAARKQKLT
ncbi:hypothetical protein V5R04_00300 [Jonesiaceae bacterium BS-20]|uniref:Uncharacterized protein n=1 Tax=Jonesiaceae bacterium BS-20 TaxID=3120821 RepID=A0AAU7DY92_9MICO